MTLPNLLATRLGVQQVCLGLLFVAIHGAAILMFRAHIELASSIFLVGAPLIAGRACLKASRAVEPVARRGWILMSAAMLVWAVGCASSAASDLIGDMPTAVAAAPDFLFFFYGVAMLFAATWTEDDALGSLAFWFDGVQALLATFLAYIAIFNVLPFSRTHIDPVQAALLLPTYDLENVILAGIAVLRLLGRSPSPTRWVFDRSVLLYTVTYGPVAGLYNHVFADQSGWPDLLIPIPFLILAGIAGGPDPNQARTPGSRRMLALFVDSAGPIFFTSTVVAFGALIVPHHAALGVCSIVLALIIYGTRAALLQSLYVHAQQSLREARDDLERLSLEDALTHVANRRHLDLALQSSWDVAQRSGHPLSFLLLDADNFKNLNDCQGHQAGDACLVRLASALQSIITRRTDLVARYGGEEFALLLPNTDLAGALQIAELAREAVHRLQILNPTTSGHYLTVSIGVASTDQQHYSVADSLVDDADRALYAAKKGGRNRVIAAAQLQSSIELPEIIMA